MEEELTIVPAVDLAYAIASLVTALTPVVAKAVLAFFAFGLVKFGLEWVGLLTGEPAFDEDYLLQDQYGLWRDHRTLKLYSLVDGEWQEWEGDARYKKYLRGQS